MIARLPILVLNGGSSSIKFSVYEAADTLTLLYGGEASGIGTPYAQFTFHATNDRIYQQHVSASKAQGLRSFRDTVQKIADILDQPGVSRPLAIGHRIVHSGPNLTAHQRITPGVLADIEQAATFAPLHQPIALEIIHEAMHRFPGVANYACFDTVFHQDMPEVSSIYPVPKSIRDLGVHRYGFHGLSCESVMHLFHEGRISNGSLPSRIPARLIIAHLGSGASVTAVRDGKPFDTTMGLTPLGGITMGTRPGDLDPGLVFYLLRMHAGSSANATDAVEQLLNKNSGLLALSGLSNDMRILRDAVIAGNRQAAFAIEVFIRSVKNAIGGFVALMGGVDALIFTGGIGEHDALSRSEICFGLDAFGIIIDLQKNETTQPEVRRISQPVSSTAIYVLPAEEDQMIASHVARMMNAH